MELLDSCRDAAHRFYIELLHAGLKSLRDRLFEQSEQGKSNDEQRYYFEAMRQVNDYGKILQQVFEQQLQDSYRQFEAGKEQERTLEESISRDKLSLVQREELEDELAVSVIVSKANSLNTESLWKLNRRLAVLRGGKPVSDETNPFGPTVVAHALQEGVKVLDVDIRARVFVYKHLGRLFLNAFGKILDQLNQRLVEGNVLPNLKFVLSKSANAEQASPEQTAEDAGHRQLEAGAEHQRELYENIVDLQRRAVARGPRTGTLGGVDYGKLNVGGDSGGPGSFAPVDYALVLSALQQSTQALHRFSQGQPLSMDQVEENFFNSLSKQGQSARRDTMPSQDADTVDLVGMIFRYMLDDPNLNDIVKSLLSHLHTPYLKLALLDQDFLEHHDHPARLLLNSMAEMGARWVENEHDKLVLPKLRSVVDTVLRGFVDDTSMFDRLLEDFQRFREGVEKRAEMVEQRNREAQQGIERLTVAKERAATELEARMNEKGVDEDIQRLLLKPWTDFLAYTLLRHGDEGLSWRSALKVVDGVLWSVRRDVSEQGREAFHKRQQELDKTIKEGLDAIGYHQEAGDRLLSALKEAQDIAYSRGDRKRQSKPAAEPTPVPEAEPEAAPEPAPAQEQPAPAQRKAHKSKEPEVAPEVREKMEELEQLQFGSWFEFDRQGANKPQQLKLAWYSRVSAHYMFVNQAGVKQAIETLTSFATGVCEGRIRPLELENRSFMERALEAVFNRLKRLV